MGRNVACSASGGLAPCRGGQRQRSGTDPDNDDETVYQSVEVSDADDEYPEYSIRHDTTEVSDMYYSALDSTPYQSLRGRDFDTICNEDSFMPLASSTIMEPQCESYNTPSFLPDLSMQSGAGDESYRSARSQNIRTPNSAQRRLPPTQQPAVSLPQRRRLPAKAALLAQQRQRSPRQCPGTPGVVFDVNQRRFSPAGSPDESSFGALTESFFDRNSGLSDESTLINRPAFGPNQSASANNSPGCGGPCSGSSSIYEDTLVNFDGQATEPNALPVDSFEFYADLARCSPTNPCTSFDQSMEMTNTSIHQRSPNVTPEANIEMPPAPQYLEGSRFLDAGFESFAGARSFSSPHSPPYPTHVSSLDGTFESALDSFHGDINETLPSMYESIIDEEDTPESPTSPRVSFGEAAPCPALNATYNIPRSPQEDVGPNATFTIQSGSPRQPPAVNLNATYDLPYSPPIRASTPEGNIGPNATFSVRPGSPGQLPGVNLNVTYDVPHTPPGRASTPQGDVGQNATFTVPPGSPRQSSTINLNATYEIPHASPEGAGSPQGDPAVNATFVVGGNADPNATFNVVGMPMIPSDRRILGRINYNRSPVIRRYPPPQRNPPPRRRRRPDIDETKFENIFLPRCSPNGPRPTRLNFDGSSSIAEHTPARQRMERTPPPNLGQIPFPQSFSYNAPPASPSPRPPALSVCPSPPVPLLNQGQRLPPRPALPAQQYPQRPRLPPRQGLPAQQPAMNLSQRPRLPPRPRLPSPQPPQRRRLPPKPPCLPAPAAVNLAERRRLPPRPAQPAMNLPQRPRLPPRPRLPTPQPDINVPPQRRRLPPRPPQPAVNVPQRRRLPPKVPVPQAAPPQRRRLPPRPCLPAPQPERRRLPPKQALPVQQPAMNLSQRPRLPPRPRLPAPQPDNVPPQRPRLPPRPPQPAVNVPQRRRLPPKVPVPAPQPAVNAPQRPRLPPRPPLPIQQQPVNIEQRRRLPPRQCPATQAPVADVRQRRPLPPRQRDPSSLGILSESMLNRNSGLYDESSLGLLPGAYFDQTPPLDGSLCPAVQSNQHDSSLGILQDTFYDANSYFCENSMPVGAYQNESSLGILPEDFEDDVYDESSLGILPGYQFDQTPPCCCPAAESNQNDTSLGTLHDSFFDANSYLCEDIVPVTTGQNESSLGILPEDFEESMYDESSLGLLPGAEFSLTPPSDESSLLSGSDMGSNLTALFLPTMIPTQEQMQNPQTILAHSLNRMLDAIENDEMNITLESLQNYQQFRRGNFGSSTPNRAEISECPCP